MQYTLRMKAEHIFNWQHLFNENDLAPCEQFGSDLKGNSVSSLCEPPIK